MSENQWLDTDDLDSLLQDIDVYNDQDDWAFPFGNYVDQGNKLVASNESACEQIVFRSSKDTRTLAKIRRQAQPKQLNNCASHKRKRSLCQPHEFKLVAFPSFEKCDSLLFFPHTLSRLVNSSDKASLARVFNTYFGESCEVQLCGLAYRSDFPHKRLMDLFALLWDTNPDFMMCVHDTKVVDNMIVATTYCKYTECKLITDSVRRLTSDPMLLGLLDCPGEQLKREMQIETRPEGERNEICALIDSGLDVLVYAKMDVNVQFDVYTKKITALQFDMRITSLCHKE